MARGKLDNIADAIAAGDVEGVKKHLTIRQLRFCEEYVVDFNATAAAKRAGYGHKYAEKQASQLMDLDGIRYYIDSLTQSKASRITVVDPDYVIARVTAIIDGSAKDADKLRGLELIARHLGMLRDKTEISGPDGGALEIEQRTKEEVSSVIAALKSMRRKAGLTLVSNNEDEAVNG